MEQQIAQGTGGLRCHSLCDPFVTTNALLFVAVSLVPLVRARQLRSKCMARKRSLPARPWLKSTLTFTVAARRSRMACSHQPRCTRH
jgi:hypothetical protein